VVRQNQGYPPWPLAALIGSSGSWLIEVVEDDFVAPHLAEKIREHVDRQREGVGRVRIPRVIES
jgi:hypothetical protein